MKLLKKITRKKNSCLGIIDKINFCLSSFFFFNQQACILLDREREERDRNTHMIGRGRVRGMTQNQT